MTFDGIPVQTDGLLTRLAPAVRLVPNPATARTLGVSC